MRRRNFIAMPGDAAASGRTAERAQQPGRMRRVGVKVMRVGLVAGGVLLLTSTIAGAETATVTSDHKFVGAVVADLGFQPRELIERVRYLASVPYEAPVQHRLSYCVERYAGRIATDAKLRETVAAEADQRACEQFGLCQDPGRQQIDQSLLYAELLRVLASEMRGEMRAEFSQVFKEHESFVAFGRHLARTNGIEGTFRQASIVTGEVSAPYIHDSCPYSWKSWPVLMSGLIGAGLLAGLLALVYKRTMVKAAPT